MRTTSDRMPPLLLQCDAHPADEAAPTVDRGREEGRWVHGASPGGSQQPRRGGRASGARGAC